MKTLVALLSAALTLAFFSISFAADDQNQCGYNAYGQFICNWVLDPVYIANDNSFHSWEAGGYHMNSQGKVYDNQGNSMPQYDSGPEQEYHSWDAGGYHRNGKGEVYDNSGKRMPQYE